MSGQQSTTKGKSFLAVTDLLINTQPGRKMTPIALGHKAKGKINRGTNKISFKILGISISY